MIDVAAPSRAAAPGPEPARRSLADRLLAAFSADQWRAGMAGHAILWGAGYLLGPAAWSSSSSFDVIRLVPVPLRVWGGLFVVLGLALLLVRRWAGGLHGLLAVLWFVWAAGLLLALPYGSLAAWGGWLHVLVVSAVHRHLSGVGRQ